MQTVEVQHQQTVVGNEDVEIGETLQNATQNADTVEAVVRFDTIDRESVAIGNREVAVSQYKAHAEQSQKTFLSWAEKHDAIDVEQTFWLANAVLVEIRTDQVSPGDLADQPGVVRVHANHQYSVPDVTEEPVDPSTQNVTYGLEQLNVTDVWEQGITGDGADIAILDTGVDGNHSDIDIDPAHWQEWDSDGNPIDTVPHDGQGHGTHVSGTVVGDDNPAGDVPAFGVAPDATLWHGKVLADDGGGSFAQVLAGMQWTVNSTDADVVGMSLGASGHVPDLIEPTENIHDAGMIFTASIGNGGPGTSGAPGNYYSSFASGAVDENYDPAPFSGGEVINTSQAWGSNAPDYWPDEYVQPNAATAGVGVLSAQPGGSYQQLSGTSMSQPHKAGVFALMVSAAGTTNQQQFTDIVEQTAWQPNGSQGPNPTYGHGIIDASAAVSQVAYNQSIAGMVTDANGAPIEGAEVTVEETGLSTSTDENGYYQLVHESGTWNVTVDAFGHAQTTETVDLGDNETVTHNVSLAPELDVKLLDDQQSIVESGQNVTVTVQPAYAESVTITEAAGYSGNLTLYVDGEEAALGDAVALDNDSWAEPVEIVVTTDPAVNGTVELQHTFAGTGDQLTVSTGPTEVLDELTNVAVVDESSDYGSDVQSRLDEQLSSEYVIDVISSSEAVDAAQNGVYDVYVVNSMDPNVVAEFDALTAGEAAGVVWLDQWGPVSNGIEAKSAVLGDPASTSDDDVTPHPELEIGQSHPIFEGVGSVGDSVQLHDATWADHSWFSGYDGNVIGTIDAGGVSDGSSVGIDETDRTVLLSSFGSTNFVSESDYTQEADMILANSVEYLRGDFEFAASLDIEDANVTQQFPEDEVTLSAEHNQTAGFQAFIEFDPSSVQITDVDGQDMGIQYELDNQDGWLHISGAQAQGIDDPELADITFNASGLAGGETTILNLAGDSVVNDETGSQLPTALDDGEIHALDRELGDVLGDGKVHSGDAVVLQRYLAGLDTPVPDEEIETYGDVDQDGEITSADVTAILQYVTQPDHPGFEPEEDSIQRLQPIQPRVGLAG